jgi:hypothetical protein
VSRGKLVGLHLSPFERSSPSSDSCYPKEIHSWDTATSNLAEAGSVESHLIKVREVEMGSEIFPQSTSQVRRAIRRQFRSELC